MLPATMLLRRLTVPTLRRPPLRPVWLELPVMVELVMLAVPPSMTMAPAMVLCDVAADGRVRQVEHAAPGHADAAAVAHEGEAVRDGAVLKDERPAVNLQGAVAAGAAPVRDVDVAQCERDARVHVEDAVEVGGVDGRAVGVAGDEEVVGHVEVAGLAALFVRAREREGDGARQVEDDAVHDGAGLAPLTLRVADVVVVGVVDGLAQRADVRQRRGRLRQRVDQNLDLYLDGARRGRERDEAGGESHCGDEAREERQARAMGKAGRFIGVSS